METPDETNSIEVLDDLEICKRGAEQSFQRVVHNAQQQIEDIVLKTKSRKEDVSLKKGLEKISQENIEAIRSVGKEAIKTLQKLHKESKLKLQTIYNSSTTALGNTLILDNLRSLTNFLDQVLKRYTDMIHESVQAGIKHIKSDFKDLKKSDASSSLK